jgi:hypothetical protein
VQHFIEFLKSKTKNNNWTKQRNFGAAKGFFEVHNDFDEPLEDFKIICNEPSFGHTCFYLVF